MQRFYWLLLLPSLLLLLGCNRISDEDLGEVLKELPKVPGAEKPYDMTNELGPALPEDPDMEPPLF